MNLIEEALRRIATDLGRLRHEWALVGGLAVSARAEPRFTNDVDVAIAVPDDDAAEDLVRSLLPVARTGQLIAVKLLARDDSTRPQDLADLRALLDVATSSDLELAQASVGLITTRGFDRGRDLKAALDELISR